MRNIVLNIRIYPNKIVFDNNEIVSNLLHEYQKIEEERCIEIEARHGAIDALYTILAYTIFKFNIYAL